MILDKIVQYKKEEVAAQKAKVLPKDLEKLLLDLEPTNSLYRALKKTAEVALIAEVKKASPSKGVIRADFDPVEIAKIYSENGCSAISVLTDNHFFQGSPEYLKAIRQITKLPLLRKEFIIDTYQIYEARTLGADAILLIAAILDDSQLADYLQLAGELGLECLVEVHTEPELKRVLKTDARIIGINNRDLNSFKTDINTTFKIKELINDGKYAVVSESGINTGKDVEKLSAFGVDAMLVGEALVRETDIAAKIKELLKEGDCIG